jgi:glycosyltransferase involved in cell wall biosynthesis
MPRTGINPSRGKKSDYRPSRVTLAMLTYIPDQSGYFQHRFEVLRLSLESLIAHSPADTDLLVFDNGSCREVVDYLRSLRDAGHIRYLLLSSLNIGKIGAFQILFRAAPGEVIAYSDDDILFLPGWLEQSLRVLDAFPRAGTVSGYYVRSHMKHGINATLAYARQPGSRAQSGKLIPEAWERQYADNYGRTWEQYEAEVSGVEDIRLDADGVQAFVSAHHMQFLIPKKVILEALPEVWGGQLMGQMKELDISVDTLGYLRLSTAQPVIRFLGNAVSQDNAALARSFGLEAGPTRVGSKPIGLLARLYRNKTVHYLAQGLYNRLYRVINAYDQG